jgi:N-carbamoylputrescine amidase
MEHARAYGEAGAQLLLNPRSTERQSQERWLTGGRVAAMVSGAYCLSANHVNDVGQVPAGDRAPYPLGGMGWIVDPDGHVLATTDDEEPFVTRELDLAAADRAKGTYPRYVARGARRPPTADR